MALIIDGFQIGSRFVIGPLNYTEVNDSIDPVLVDAVWHYVDEDPTSARFLGTYNIGDEFTIPFATEVDRDITVRVIARFLDGTPTLQPDEYALAPSVTFASTRIDAIPSISLVRPATWKHARIGIDNWSRFARVRKVEFAFNLAGLLAQNPNVDGYGMRVFDLDLGSDGVSTTIQSNTLPDWLDLSREYADSGTPTFGEPVLYVRISHSFESTSRATGATYLDKVNTLRFTAWSNILQFNWATEAIYNSGGAGGETPDVDPTIGIPDAYETIEGITDYALSARGAELLSASEFVPGLVTAGPEDQYFGGSKFFRNPLVAGLWAESASGASRPDRSDMPPLPAITAYQAPLASYALATGKPGTLHFYRAETTIPVNVLLGETIGRIAPATKIAAAAGLWRFSGRIDFVPTADPDATNMPVAVDIYGGYAHLATDATGIRGLRVDHTGGAILGVGNLAGAATGGFAWVPEFAGTPTGVPSPDYPGYVALGIFGGAIFINSGAGWTSSGGGGSPGGSATEIQYRSGASTFGAVTSSSVSGADVTWAGLQTQTLTSTSTSSISFLDQNLTLSPASSASAATFKAFDQSIAFGTAQAIGPIRMRYVSVTHNQSAAVTSYYDTESNFTKNTGGNLSVLGGWSFTGTISAGTTAQALGSSVNLATGGGTITAGYGYEANAENSSGTFTKFVAYQAFASGTIGTLYGFVSSSGFLHGLGTLTPTATLHVHGGDMLQTGATDVSPTLSQYAFGISPTIITMHRTKGTQALPTALALGDRLGQIRFSGNYDTTVVPAGYTTNMIGAIIQADAAANWDATNAAADLYIRTRSTVAGGIVNAVIVTSDQRTVIGSAVVRADATHTLTVSGTSKITGAALFGGTVTQTLTDTSTSSTLSFLDQNITISPAGTSSAIYRAFDQGVTFGTAQTLSSDVVMRYFSVTHSQNSSLGGFYGTYGSFAKDTANSVTGVVGNYWQANINSGTTANAYGFQSALNVAGGTIAEGVGVYSAGTRASGTFTTFTAFQAVYGGTIGTKYGFASSAGFLHGFGTLTPTVTMDVVGGSLFTLSSGQTLNARSDVQTIAIWDTAVASTTASDFRFIKSRGSVASRGAVASGDSVGNIFWLGYYDSSTSFAVAAITATAQGAFASFDWPTDLVFQTASTSTRRTGMRLTSDQRLGVGDQIAHADVTHRLTVVGDVKADATTKGFGLYDTSQSNLAQYYSQFGTAPLGHELYFQKASGTQAAPGNAGTTAENLGTIYWQARNAGAYATIASINGFQDSGGSGLVLGATGGASIYLYSNGMAVSVGSDATGDMYYRNSSGRFVRLGVGTNGYILTLAAGLPTWAANAGGGANTALSNLASVSINASLIPQTGLDLGAAATAWRDLYLYGSGTFATTSLRLTGTPTGNRTITIPNATATLATLAEAEVFTNKTLSTGTAVSVAISWADGVTQTFNPNGTASGLNVGSNSGAPSAPNNGDVYYDSGSGNFQFRKSAAWCVFTPAGSGTELQYRVDHGNFGAVTSSSVSGANVTWGGTQTQTLTNTSTSSTLSFLDQNLTLSPASSAAAATFRAFEQSVAFGTAQAIGPIRMRHVSVDHNQSAAVTSYYDTESSFTKSTGGNISVVGGTTFSAYINAGTTTQATGVAITLGTNGGIITAGYGYDVGADNSSGTFTTFTAYRATFTGTVGTKYGYASMAGFLHGLGTLTPGYTLDVQQTTSATTGLSVLNCFDYTSSGTPAATFGLAELYRLKSSTTANQSAAQLGVRWQTATHASRSAVYGLSTVTPMGLTPTPTLGERWLVGGMKALTDNTTTDLFSVSFGVSDHKATGGFVRFTLFAKQTTGSNQIQAYVRVVPWAAIHNAATNTGAATWGSEALGAAVTSTGGFSTLSFRINTSATMPQSGVNLFTFQILVDSDLTTPIEMTAHYDVSYSGEIDIALS